MTRAGIEFVVGKLANITLQSDLLERIKTAQRSDPKLQEFKERLEAGSTKDFSISLDELLRYKDRVCAVADKGIRQEILEKSHTTPYSLHPGTTKMYHDVKALYWWLGMKGDIVSIYQSTIGMEPYEMLYRRKCCSPIHWDEASERRYLGPDAVQRTSEAIKKIQARMLASQSKQKSYADPKRRNIEFQVGDFVFLQVSLMKGIQRFGKKRKLSPRFIGPSEILERVCQVTYRLALPLHYLESIMCSTSRCFKNVSDMTHVLTYEDIELQTDLSYEEQPTQILDRKENVLWNKTILLVEVLWRNGKVEEATWELES
ncbi:hypothetical protein CsatB_017745 [Cannabis sativa]|uniref:uncharacterized protein LOC115710431 n=1 Tax=Cannabis sativa TaxID=3483 RepID=UPI0029CA7128|nr:uncharacterized protein LOC115710431 [Cannabis sativa]